MSLRLRQLRLHDCLLGALVLAAAAIPDWRSCDRPTSKIANSSAPPDLAPPVRDPVRYPIGLVSVADYDWLERTGSHEYARAQAAYKAKDWREVEARCRAAIAADPLHLHAHSLLASSLARQQRWGEVGDPLSLTLAGDWRHFGASFDADSDFAEFLATPWGARLAALAAEYRSEFQHRVKGGLLVVGRPSPPRARGGSGRQRSNLDSEIYAWDFETHRFLRVTRSRGEVAGFFSTPLNGGLVYAAISKLFIPTPDERGAGAVPLIADGEVVRIDGTEASGSGLSEQIVRLRLDGRESGLLTLALQFDGSERLLATEARSGGSSTYFVDFRRNAMINDFNASGRGATLVVGATGSVLLQAPPPGSEGAVSAALALLGGAARTGSLVRSPAARWLAFTTEVEPCAPNPAQRQSSLVIADSLGRSRQVARGEELFAARFLDDDRLVYEDGTGGLRVVVAATGVEAASLASPGGLGLWSFIERPVCVAAAAKNDSPPPSIEPPAPSDSPLLDPYDNDGSE